MRPHRQREHRQRQRDQRPEASRHRAQFAAVVLVLRLGIIGSSAMPHFGQWPGPTCCTSGCIGTGVDRAGRRPARARALPVMQITPRIGDELVAAALRHRSTRSSRRARHDAVAVSRIHASCRRPDRRRVHRLIVMRVLMVFERSRGSFATATAGFLHRLERFRFCATTSLLVAAHASPSSSASARRIGH